MPSDDEVVARTVARKSRSCTAVLDGCHKEETSQPRCLVVERSFFSTYFLLTLLSYWPEFSGVGSSGGVPSALGSSTPAVPVIGSLVTRIIVKEITEIVGIDRNDKPITRF